MTHLDTLVTPLEPLRPALYVTQRTKKEPREQSEGRTSGINHLIAGARYDFRLYVWSLFITQREIWSRVSTTNWTDGQIHFIYFKKKEKTNSLTISVMWLKYF